MAWEWSHTLEAYAAAYDNTARLPRKTLLEILREWTYYDREQAGKRGSFRLRFNPRRCRKDDLVDRVWQRAEEHATCSNGGWDAYLCPDGCHTVSFDRAEE